MGQTEGHHSEVPTLTVRCFPKATMLSGTNMGRGLSTSSAQVTWRSTWSMTTSSKIYGVDMLPVPYYDEFADENMEVKSKGPEEKMVPDLPVPPKVPEEKGCLTYQSQQPLPKSPSQMSDVTSVWDPSPLVSSAPWAKWAPHWVSK